MELVLGPDQGLYHLRKTPTIVCMTSPEVSRSICQGCVFATEGVVIHILSFISPYCGCCATMTQSSSPVTVPRFPCLGLNCRLFSGETESYASSTGKEALFQQTSAHELQLCAAIETARGLFRFLPNDVQPFKEKALVNTAVECVGINCPEIIDWLRKLLELRALSFEASLDPAVALRHLTPCVSKVPLNQYPYVHQEVEILREDIKAALAKGRVLAKLNSDARRRAELGPRLYRDFVEIVATPPSPDAAAQLNCPRIDSTLCDALTCMVHLRDALSCTDWRSADFMLYRAKAVPLTTISKLTKHEIEEAQDMLLDYAAKQAMCSALVHETTTGGADRGGILGLDEPTELV